MTAEEKALDLIDKYFFIKVVRGKSVIGVQLSFASAKRASLICVDEILDDLNNSKEVCGGLHPHTDGLISGSIVFWESVKSRIEKINYFPTFYKFLSEKHKGWH